MGSRAEILLPRGFEAEVFVQGGIDTPTDLDIDAQGNLYVASASDSASVCQVTPQGVVVPSVNIYDPDGVAVGPFGEVLVAGGHTIWEVVYPSGSTTVFDSCHNNVNSLVIGADGAVYAGDDNGQLLLVANGCEGDSLLGGISNVQAVIRDEMSGAMYVGGVGTEVYRIIDGIVEPVSSGINRVGDLAWGPGGEVFGSDLYVAENTDLRISIVDPVSGQTAPFATFDDPSDAPDGLAFADSLTLYATQPFRNRILRIRYTGTAAPERVTQSWGLLKASYR